MTWIVWNIYIVIAARELTRAMSKPPVKFILKTNPNIPVDQLDSENMPSNQTTISEESNKCKGLEEIKWQKPRIGYPIKI